MIFWTILLGLGGIIISVFDWRRNIFGYVGRIWSKIILYAANVPYSVKGLDNLQKNENYVFAGNHESAFDIPLAFAGIPYHLVSISKKELKWIPVFGWAMQAGGHIFVDRRQHGKAVSSLDKAVSSLQNFPRSIVLFPEGTRSIDGKIHKFKKGGLVLAIKANLPVVPFAVCGTAEVVTKGSWHLKSKPIELRIGNPISTINLNYEDRNEFVNAIRTDVIRLKNEWQSEQAIQINYQNN
ncbi:lysophospholipid acyltransferase family protein [Candidatus Neomarinimicrobiota bacterium]